MQVLTWNPKNWFSKITSIEFCKRGHPTKNDLNTVLEMFIRGQSLKLELEPLSPAALALPEPPAPIVIL